MNTDIIIRLATYKDIEGISELNKKWLTNDIDNINKSDGFLFGEAYTKDELRKIISEDELCVAICDNKVVGYFLFDNYSSNSTTQLNLKCLDYLISNQIIDSKKRICTRSQIAILKEYHGKNISIQLVKYLVNKTTNKYDFVFAIVSKLNPKMEAHKKAGWEIIYEDDKLYYITLKLK